MPQILLIFASIYIVYLVSKRFTKKEKRRFEKSEGISEVAEIDLSSVDNINEVVVNFIFDQLDNQFLVNSEPNIQIDNAMYKMTNNSLQVKLNKEFYIYFYVPYMGRKSYKLKQAFNLTPGRSYQVIIKPRPLVFQTPKVEVVDNGSI